MDATTTKMMQGTTWGAYSGAKSHSEEAIKLTAGQSELVQAIHSKIAVLKNGEPRAREKWKADADYPKRLRQRLLSQLEDNRLRRLYLSVRTEAEAAQDAEDGKAAGEEKAKVIGVIIAIICGIIGVCAGITTRKVAYYPWYFLGMVQRGETTEVASFSFLPAIGGIVIAWILWAILNHIVSHECANSFRAQGPRKK